MKAAVTAVGTAGTTRAAAANASRALLVAALLSSAACAPRASDFDVAIRDVRPTTIEVGDVVTVEADGPRFTVGQPTLVSFEDLAKGGVRLRGRAVDARRVLVDVTAGVAQQLGADHRVVATHVTVIQTAERASTFFRSSPTAPFTLDLFPPSLRQLTTRANDAVAARARLWDWLGVVLREEQGSVWVAGTRHGYRPADLLAKYDTAPKDGRITLDESRATKSGDPGAMPYGDFWDLDGNHDGTLDAAELARAPEEDPPARRAGLEFGDYIVTADGREVTTLDDLAAAWDAPPVATEGAAVDAPVRLTLRRTSETAASDRPALLPRKGHPTRTPPWLVAALMLLAVAALVAAPIPLVAGLVVVWERKVSAWMQSRIGPNRVGPSGWLQWLADGLKLLMKEDIVPTGSDALLFKSSPYLAFVGLFLVFVVLPATSALVVADLDVGVLFLLSVTSLVVVSIIMGGWSSNSKWSLLGGMRSAAQIISYELPAGVALLVVAVWTGSLSLQAIVRAQGGAPWSWYLFHDPFTFVAFFIYFIAALAEGNRTPFDLPEAESELVSGYNTEYSGFRFSLFPLVEWVNLFVIGAVATTLFLGGWRVPLVGVAMSDKLVWQLVGGALFLAKTIAIVFVIIWIRWTLPRFRVDQMMTLCWKYLVPASFTCLGFALVWSWLVPPSVTAWSRFLWFALLGALPLVLFIRRVRFHRARFRPLDLNPTR